MIRCHACGAEWTGVTRAHCGFGCHQTFSGVTAFEAHQSPKHGATSQNPCVNPLQAGLALRKRPYPYWGDPLDDNEGFDAPGEEPE